MRRCFVSLVLILLATAASAQPNSLERVSQPWKGDLSEMLEKGRPVRVLVSYDHTNFFMSGGSMRGMEADFMNAYKDFLKKRHPDKVVRMVFLAVPYDDLIPALLEGRGDVIAAGMTVTPPRSRQVDFSVPYRSGVDEIVVGGPASRPLSNTDSLAGHAVTVMAGSSYVEHLMVLNRAFKARGLQPVKVHEVDPALATENLLEMAARGLLEYVVVEKPMAEVWKTALPDLRIFEDAVIYPDGKLAWAIRKNSPELKGSLDAFAPTVRMGTLHGNMFFKRYYTNEEHVADAKDPLEYGKLGTLADLFKKYAKKYDFDWLKIAALAYQESRFNQDLKSGRGAVGIMQIKPSTAADPNVNIDHVEKLENNIHAGVKYLRFLCDTYFQDVPQRNQVDFALAAYNAGPAKVRSLRKKAAQMGLNPDLWFGNVEWAARREIGSETPSYVAHVQMYWAAYRSMASLLKERGKAM